MKAQLFTQEGKEYIVRTANTSFSPTLGVAQTMNKMIYVNVADPAASAIDPYFLAIKTSGKNIIPLAYSLSASDNNTTTIVADVSNCYFYSQSWPSTLILPAFYKSLDKIFPYVERVYYTDANNNNFISRYNQIIFSDSDFIPTSDPMALQANSSLAGAFNGVLAATDKPVLPVGTLYVTISFTYLELQ